MTRDRRLDEPRHDSLIAHAAMWVDMEPHIGHLADLARDATSILEWGVRGGVSTWALLDGLPAAGTMTSVDVERHLLPDRVTGDPRWSFVLGDDLAVPVPDADLVFIDTTHTYNHTLAELRRADALGAEVIALHDYALDPVALAITRWKSDAWTLAVLPSRWGLAVLRRNPR